MNFWKFIAEKFSQMPKWVQVVTWFVMLALTVYLYISPRFINGQMVVAVDNGGTIEYRGATLRTHIDGRVLKYTTNEDGFWSVPVVSRFPQAVRLQVYHEDAHAWYDVTIDGKTVWANSMGGKEIRLVVQNNPPSVKPQIVEWNGGNSPRRSIFTAFLELAASAWADDTDTPRPRENKDKISRKIESIIAGATGRMKRRGLETADDPGTADLKLTGKGAPTYSQKLKIIHAAEKEFKMKIPDEEWRTMSTSGELADYIYNAQRKQSR